MRAVVWNTSALPIPGTSYFHVKKFMSGFISYGFELAEANSHELINQLTKDDIVYVSNHGFDHSNFEEALREFEFLAKRDSIFILWHFHNHLDDAVFDSLPSRLSFTGEHHPTSEELYDRYRADPRFHSTKFLSSLSPALVGEIQRNPRFDAQYVGAPYEQALMSRLSEKVKLVGRYTPPFVSEEERISTFLQSHCSLGFHSPENLAKRLVTERVAEGLALGCIVISNNTAAPDFTDGCAIYAQTLEEFVENIERAREDKNWRTKKQQEGYNFVRSKGTYTHLAASFLRHFAKCDLI